MSLKQLALKVGAVYPESAAQRLMVLASVPTSAALNFVREQSKTGHAGWMETLVDVGALDLGAQLRECSDAAEGHKIVKQWAELSVEFLNFIAPSTRLSEEKASPKIVFTDDPIRHELLDKAIFRFLQTSNELQGLVFPSEGWANPTLAVCGTLNEKSAHQMVTTQVLSTWAGVAAALGRVEALKALIDAFPQALSCTVPVLTKPLAPNLEFKQSTTFYGTNALDRQNVSPLFCALWASQQACVDVIMDQLESIGASLDSPIASQSFTTLLDKRNMLDVFLFCDAVFSPDVAFHALQRVLNRNESKKDAFREALIDQAQNHPRLFALFARQGFFKSPDVQRQAQLLTAALRHAGEALEFVVEGLDWEGLTPFFGTKQSPIFCAVSNSGGDNVEPRQKAILKLIEIARRAGREDVVFQVFPVKTKGKVTGWPAPLTTLSVAGFDEVLKAFLDHGVDAHSPLDAFTPSLLSIAQQNNHPTLELIRSHSLHN